MAGSDAYARIRADLLRLVAAVPRGRVATFGALGRRLDVPARHVAYILARLDAATRDGMAWHRVVRDDGTLPGGAAQAARLRAEGVAVDERARVLLQETAVEPAALRVRVTAKRPPQHQRRNGDPALAELRGLGPASVRMLVAAGVRTTAQLRRADPVALYLRIRARAPRASLNLLFALVGAVEDRDWREVARRDRTALLMRLDDRERGRRAPA